MVFIAEKLFILLRIINGEIRLEDTLLNLNY